MEIIDRIKQVYSSREGQLNAYQNEIEDACIKGIINEYSSKHRNQLKIFSNPEHRKKDVNSLAEKLKRKGYFYSGLFNDRMSDDELFDKVLMCLGDVLGFRITCFFTTDEKEIYNFSKAFCNELSAKNRLFKFNFEDDERKREKENNPARPFKWEGTYKNKLKFEVQIKSLSSTLWSEVQHEVAYKKTKCDLHPTLTASVTDESRRILEATSRELEQLYKQDIEKENLYKKLFYDFTIEDITTKNDVTILFDHYKNFFVFADMKVIKEYVGKKILNECGFEEKYLLKETRIRETAELKGLKHVIQERYDKFELQVFKSIFDVLYNDKKDDYLSLIGNHFLKPSRELINDGSEIDGFFGPDENEDAIKNFSLDKEKETFICDSLDKVFKKVG